MKKLVGKVLISEPFLDDPSFSRSVVLLTEHNEDGSVGFVLNQKTDFAVNLVMEELETVNNFLYQGGPVELESFHYIHKYPHIVGSARLSENVYWSGDFTQVQDGIRDGSLDPNGFKFFIGYSGWAYGQLDDELQDKSWLVGEVSEKLLFDNSIADSDLWKHAMKGMKGSDSLLANSPMNPTLN